MKKLFTIIAFLFAVSAIGQTTFQTTTLLDTTKANGNRIVVKWNGSGEWRIEDSTINYISINNSGFNAKVYVQCYVQGEIMPPDSSYYVEYVWVPLRETKARFSNYYSSTIFKNDIRRNEMYIVRRKIGEFLFRR